MVGRLTLSMVRRSLQGYLQSEGTVELKFKLETGSTNGVARLIMEFKEGFSDPSIRDHHR